MDCQQCAGFFLCGNVLALIAQRADQTRSRRRLTRVELQSFAIGALRFFRPPGSPQQMSQIRLELRLARLQRDALAEQSFAVGYIAPVLSDQPEQVGRSGVARRLQEKIAASAFCAGKISLPHQSRYVRQF
jgi:hypothetical protein